MLSDIKSYRAGILVLELFFRVSGGWVKTISGYIGGFEQKVVGMGI